MKLVIFDCDGTLVDSQHLIVAAMAGAFAGVGRVPPPRATTLSVVGLSLVEAFSELVGPDDPAIPALIEGYKGSFQALRADPAATEPLFSGAAEAVRALAARDDVLLGIATGKSQRGVRVVLGHHGLFDLFSTIQTADDAPSKPHPAMIAQAMAAVGASPHETVMIGDTTFDLAMAQAAGVAAIGVSWGYHPRAALAGLAPDLLIDGYGALLPGLDAIWSGRSRAAGGSP
ncbi:HAD-IA family hydrolase [Phreatobacter sp.]|uniref:HAD-IA family hydrolase n=1 Tax=Phreatobacter sp. TaxID=1966341 RepID=UPI003F70B629